MTNEKIDELYTQLQLQLKRKRQEEGILQMERELSGVDPGFYANIDGVPPPSTGHKRRLSINAEPAPNRRPRPKEPPTYAGMNLQELHKYEAEWEIYLEAYEDAFQSDAERVRQAATYLVDHAASEWIRRKTRGEPPIKTWFEFIKWCGDIVAPENRMMNASYRLKKAEQRPNQSVREFVRYIEHLERDLPKETRGDVLGRIVLDGLREDLRAEVIKDIKNPTSREEVVSTAQRHEEIMRNRTAKKAPTRAHEEAMRNRTTKQTPTRTHDESRQSANRSNANRSTASNAQPSSGTGKKDKSHVMCYNCGRKGHIANECRKPKKDEDSGSRNDVSSPHSLRGAWSEVGGGP
jgi:hypothetical protein